MLVLKFLTIIWFFQIETAITDKETEFKSIREELEKSKTASEELCEKLKNAESVIKELENTIAAYKQEIECISKKTRQKQVSTEEFNNTMDQVYIDKDLLLYVHEHV